MWSTIVCGPSWMVNVRSTRVRSVGRPPTSGRRRTAAKPRFRYSSTSASRSARSLRLVVTARPGCSLTSRRSSTSGNAGVPDDPDVADDVRGPSVMAIDRPDQRPAVGPDGSARSTAVSIATAREAARPVELADRAHRGVEVDSTNRARPARARRAARISAIGTAWLPVTSTPPARRGTGAAFLTVKTIVSRSSVCLRARTRRRPSSSPAGAGSRDSPARVLEQILVDRALALDGTSSSSVSAGSGSPSKRDGDQRPGLRRSTVRSTVCPSSETRAGGSRRLV